MYHGFIHCVVLQQHLVHVYVSEFSIILWVSTISSPSFSHAVLMLLESSVTHVYISVWCALVYAALYYYSLIITFLLPGPL